MNISLLTKHFERPCNLANIKLDHMPQITLNIPAEKMALFMEVVAALGLDSEQNTLNGEVPQWQKDMVEERQQEYRSGKAEFISWEDMKKELDNDEIE